MQKLIVALTAVLITGIAGFSVAGGDAQDAEKVRTVRPVQVKNIEIEEVESETEFVQLAEEDFEVYIQSAEKDPRTNLLRVANMRQEAGTWQIVTLDKMALLLNTATGETFSLEKGEEGLQWKPIARPMGHDRPDMPRMPNFRDRDMPDLEEKMKALREELRGAKGEARERIERAIEELEQKRGEKADKPRTPEPRKEGDRKEGEREDAKRERAKDDVENQLREIEETIGALKERFEDSDSIKEREKIEKTIKELKEKAEGLRKERKER